MDYLKWLDSMKPLCKERILKEVQKVTDDFHRRNVFYSTSCFFNGSKAGFNAVNIEIAKLIDKLSSLEIFFMQWLSIENILKDTIKEFYDDVVNSIKNKGFNNPDFNINQTYDEHIKESLSLLNLSISVQVQISRKRLLKYILEIFKILFVAIAGGFFGNYIRSLFE